MYHYFHLPEAFRRGRPSSHQRQYVNMQYHIVHVNSNARYITGARVQVNDDGIQLSLGAKLINQARYTKHTNIWSTLGTN